MTLTPLGLSAGRSVLRVALIAVYMVAAIVTVVGMFTITASNDVRVTYLADLGSGLMADSAWLLPALLAVNVTLIAVVAAQTFAGTDPDQVARTRNVIAVISQAVGSFALLILVFATLNALEHRDDARHLLSVYFLGLLVIVFGLWASIVVFSNPSESLRISEASLKITESSLERLHSPTHTKTQAWWAIAGLVFILGGATTAIPLVISVTLYGRVTGGGEWALTCFGITTFACFTAALGCVALTASERGALRWIFYVTIVGPLCVVPVGVLLFSSTKTIPSLAVALVFAFLAPIVSSWVPYGGQGRAHRLALGNAVRSLAYFWASSRIERINAHIAVLRREVTSLDMSATRKR
jgi:hypothetical protein